MKKYWKSWTFISFYETFPISFLFNFIMIRRAKCDIDRLT